MPETKQGITALPWIAKESGWGGCIECIEIMGAPQPVNHPQLGATTERTIICDLALSRGGDCEHNREQRATAAYIVLAVNAHEKLKAKLRAAHSALFEVLDSMGALSNPSELTGYAISPERSAEIVAAANEAEQLLRELEAHNG